MSNKLFLLVLGSALSASFAFADDIAIQCSDHPGSQDKAMVEFSSDSVGQPSMKDAYFAYRGKRATKSATIDTIWNKGQVVRYIVKDRNLTFVFSHLGKCGDLMSKREDYARVTVTRTQRSGKKELVESFLCTCDVD